jgi:hypothetical protein
MKATDGARMVSQLRSQTRPQLTSSPFRDSDLLWQSATGSS